MKKVEDYVMSIPDFPEPGIIFRDVTSVIQHPEGLKLAIDGMQDLLKDVDFDVVAGLESRGFVFGMPLAYNNGKGFVMVRKKGKLPRETVSASYALEYGTAAIEIHKDAITEDDVVLLHDDLLATGGTMVAALELVNQFKPKASYVSFIIELVCEGLHGRDAFPEGTDLYTIMTLG